MKSRLCTLLEILFLTLMLMRGLPASANNTYYFANIGLEEKLSQLSVLKIHEDYKGYIWFGTRNGLNRFDGNEMKVYKHQDDQEQNSLVDNHVTTIAESRSHNLWIGSLQGLTCIDLTTNRITPYYANKHPLLNGGARALFADVNGTLWVGTPNGLFYFSEKTKRKTTTIHQLKRLNGIAVSSLMESTKGELWVGTDQNGVYRFDKKRRLVIHYTSQGSKNRIASNEIAQIYEDSWKNIWIATKSGGLCKFNLKTGQIITYTTLNSSLTTNNIRAIVQVGRTLYLGTFDGLFAMDMSNGAISIVSHEGKGKGQLSHFSIYSLCSDRNNGLWIGTYSGGVNYYSVYNNRFTLHDPKDYISNELGIYGAMVTNRGNKLYVSTEGSGLLEWDNKANIYQCYRYNSSTHVSGRNIIKSITSIGNSQLMCGTSEGEVYVFNPSTKEFTEYSSLHMTNSIYAIHSSKDGGIWLATSKANKGLIYVRKGQGPISKFKILGQKGLYSFPSMRSMLTVSDGVFLLGSRNNGLIRFDTKKNVIKSFNKQGKEHSHLPSDYVTTITRDLKGQIWVGTFGGGLCLYDDKSGITKIVTEHNGIASNEIYSIVVDKQNRLWMSNGNCITSYQPEKGKIHNYQVDVVGVQEFSPNSGVMLNNGDICFSASNGFVTFNPNKLQLNSYSPPLVLNSLAIDNKWVSSIDGKIIDRVLDDVETLKLAHNQNNITISYCALNYSYPQQNQYAYRLVGHDKDWNYVGNRHEAYYTNLNPGKYTFELKASNNDGIWNKDIRRMTIIVRPPIWATWYAYLFYICVIGGISFLILYFVNKKRRLEQELMYEQKEQQQQKDFHEAKMNMYTSFSHELRTPLQLILSPLENLMNRHIFDLDVKNKLELIHNNSQRLLLLVNQLMDLQKSGSGKMQVKIGHYDLFSFVNEIYGAFKNIANDKEIELTYNQENIHLMAWFDKSLFEKILFNLLSNALKNTPYQGKIAILFDSVTDIHEADIPVELQSHLPVSNSLYMMRITDNGKGIPEKEIKKIFEPFYQASNNSASKGIGSGIGLSLTQTIVQLHHGIIWARNNELGGATFSIVFPIGKECYDSKDIYEESEDVLQDIIPTTKSLTIELEKRYTVLLVEDNTDLRQYVKESLTPYFDVIEAEDGKVGLDRAFSEIPDIIISDIMMPEMNGMELCKNIKEDMQTSHIPVVLITAKSMVEHIIEGYETGADDYIVKPFSVDILIHRIKNILETRDKLKDLYGKRFSAETLGFDLSSSQDAFVQKFFEIIEKNISNSELNIDFICKEIGVSRSNLYKKLRAVTQLSPIELIRDKRLEVATQLLRETDHSIFDIAILTGFSSQAYFSKCFKMVYNCSPTEYAEKYSSQNQ